MFDVDRVRKGVSTLRARDPLLQRFGADSHRYELAAPLTESEVREIERRIVLALPDSYRQFLVELGNGGAGPFYGVQAFGTADFGDWTANDGFVGDLGAPFPHVEAWNLPADQLELNEDEEHDEAAEDAHWARLDETYYTALDGAFPICHHGSAYQTWLVVTGPERGNVWFDARTTLGGIVPHESDGVRLSFDTWYQQWLERELVETALAQE